MRVPAHHCHDVREQAAVHSGNPAPDIGLGIRMNRAAAVLLCIAGVFAACSSIQQSAKVEWVGTYTVTSMQQVPDPDSLTGMRNVLYGARPAVESTHVRGNLGVHFGVGYRLLTGRAGERVGLRAAIAYPPGGLSNPETGRSLERREWNLVCTVGAQCTVGFFFREPWELKAGTWTVEVWDRSNRLVQEHFDVVVR
jgi:Domain of unknown function (DUF3859)